MCSSGYIITYLGGNFPLFPYRQLTPGISRKGPFPSERPMSFLLTNSNLGRAHPEIGVRMEVELWLRRKGSKGARQSEGGAAGPGVRAVF